MKFSSLAATEVVKMTTSGATNDYNVVETAKFSFHWDTEYIPLIMHMIYELVRFGVSGFDQRETFSALLALGEGTPPVTGGFPSQSPVTRSCDVDLPLSKWLSKQSRRRWFETPLRWLWCHCNGTEEYICFGRKWVQKGLNYGCILGISANMRYYVIKWYDRCQRK